MERGRFEALFFQSIKWNTFLKEAEINLHVKMELPSLYVLGMFLKSYTSIKWLHIKSYFRSTRNTNHSFRPIV